MFHRVESFELRRTKQPQFPPFPTTTSEPMVCARQGRAVTLGAPCCTRVCSGSQTPHPQPLCIHSRPPPPNTVGSFPQTAEVRRLRAQLRSGALTPEQYDAAVDRQIALAIGIQARAIWGVGREGAPAGNLGHACMFALTPGSARVHPLLAEPRLPHPRVLAPSMLKGGLARCISHASQPPTLASLVAFPLCRRGSGWTCWSTERPRGRT